MRSYSWPTVCPTAARSQTTALEAMDLLPYFWNHGTMNTESAVLALRALSQAHRLAAFRALVQAGPAGLTVGALRRRLKLPRAEERRVGKEGGRACRTRWWTYH